MNGLLVLGWTSFGDNVGTTGLKISVVTISVTGGLVSVGGTEGGSGVPVVVPVVPVVLCRMCRMNTRDRVRHAFIVTIYFPEFLLLLIKTVTFCDTLESNGKRDQQAQRTRIPRCVRKPTPLRQ